MSQSNEQWKRYRKTARITARVLTKEDHRQRGGVIQTPEGRMPFSVGDYLARDSGGEWPIKGADIRSSYRRVPGPDADGWEQFESTEVREAVQMSEPFTTDGGLRGQAGDYKVRDSAGNTWPVDRLLFEQTYKLVR